MPKSYYRVGLSIKKCTKMKKLSFLNFTLLILFALLSFTACNNEEGGLEVENLIIEEPQTFCDIEQEVVDMNQNAVNGVIEAISNAEPGPILVYGCPKLLEGLAFAASAQIDLDIAKSLVPVAVRFDVRNATMEVYNNFLATGDIDLSILEPQQAVLELNESVDPGSLVGLLDQANSFMQNNYQDMEDPEAFFAIEQEVVEMNKNMLQGVASAIANGGQGPYEVAGCPILLGNIALAASGQIPQDVVMGFASPSAGTDIFDGTDQVYDNFLATGDVDLGVLQPEEVVIIMDGGCTPEELVDLLSEVENFVDTNY